MQSSGSLQSGKNNPYDVLIIGGGPGGSTAATLLARQGLRVAVFEKKSFPRFHIGESLLPASAPIWDELGVHEQVKKLFIKKPGGKWYYGHRPVFSNFSQGPSDTTFASGPHAYMVRRAELDELLLNNAASKGAQVFLQHSVTDLIQEGEKVVGLVVKDQANNDHHVYADMVFDCSGFGAMISQKLKIRRENRLKRMAIFGHYKTTPVDADLKNGWFVGQMLYDGWIWLIPLKSDLISIGVVLPFERYKEANLSGEKFLEMYIRKMPIVKTGITPNPELEGKVHLYGNLGYTTSRAYGDGWVLVGDAAFFIDPCYSSGVHLALSSAREAATIYLEQKRSGKRESKVWEKYEKSLRRDEKLVLRFVDAFYMASRNRVLKWLIPVGNTESLNRDFVAMTGGDFASKPHLVNTLYCLSKIVSFVLPIPAKD